jgi:hypothetical protein
MTGQLSPDGAHYWDGRQWLPSASADGRWQWDGTQWLARSAAPQPRPLASGGRNNLAVASLVMGITCWFLSPLVGGVLAVMSGHQARREIRTSGESGGAMAAVGLVLGYMNIVVYGSVVLFWLFVFGGLTVLISILPTVHH